jgi:hypothetical protein
MSFIGSIFSAIVSVIVSIVEAVVQIIEMVVQLVMVLLGWDSGSTQIIEYYEVHNVPLFNDVDKKNPLLKSILSSIVAEQDIASNLIYHTAFRSLKGNVKEFMDFIDNGNYFENLPTVESYILTINYTELTAALNTLNGVPCTPEGSYLRTLSKKDWVQYWLQENKEYNVGTNTMGVDYSTTSTSAATPASDTVQVTASTNHFDIDITSEMTTSDEVFADERWQVDLTDIVYNSTPDTYTIKAYNAANVGAVTRTLPYIAPTKPTQLHYVSTYYRDSAPARKYLFIYKVGTGVYTDLDEVEEPIDIDGATIEAIPCVPLRLSNANYTTFGTTKAEQIEDLLAKIHLDAETVLDTILTESATDPGDLDHIYVNFGVRMWDTSQAGMSYLFTMFENLYPSQGVTQGIYNNSPVGDDKPQNNILVTTDDNKLAYQWSYITYEHTSLTAINANSGSAENGIYYSDMSKFGADNLLKYNYYVSSGKGTYNVGYKADDLDEVQDFLDGNGVTNPGTTSGEATNWLQVTERMSYNNPSPVLQEADGSTADLKYLTPDLVYENSGSGVTALTVTGGGSGYSSPPTVAITGGGGSGATATAVLTAGAVSSITITAAGSGYTTLPTVTLTGGGGAGATATAGTSGVLRLVESASHETTIGQSITYYCCKPSGLDAYTVVAPISSCRVVDGSSGHFRVVKFNLGNKADLMAPFIHNFIKDLSNDKVARLFLAGAHASIYIAHYEKIVHEGMSFLTALVMIIVIVVIAYYAYPMLKAGFGKMMVLFADMAAASTLTGALSIMMGAFIKSIPTMLFKMAAQYVIQTIITEVVGDNPELAMILNMLATVAIASWDVHISIGSAPGTAPLGSYGNTGGSIVDGQLIGGGTMNVPGTINPQGVYITGATSFSLPDLSNPTELFSLGNKLINTVGKFLDIRTKSLNEELDLEVEEYGRLMGERRQELKEMDKYIDTHSGIKSVDLKFTEKKMFQTSHLNAEAYYRFWEHKGGPMITTVYNYDYLSLPETSIQFT